MTYYTPFFAEVVDTRAQLMTELKKAKEKFNAELQAGKDSKDITFPTLGRISSRTSVAREN